MTVEMVQKCRGTGALSFLLENERLPDRNCVKSFQGRCSPFNNGNLDPTKLPPKPVLSYDQITSVDTLAGLEKLYHRAGIQFKDYHQFLAQISSDWLIASNKLSEKVSSDAFSKTFPPLSVSVADKKYHIYGVVHDDVIGEKTMKTIERTIKPKQNWMYEQNLDSVFDIGNGIELPDHLVSEEKTPLNPLTQMWVGIKWSLPEFISKYLPGPDYLLPEHKELDKDEDSDLILKEKGRKDNTTKQVLRLMRVPETLSSTGNFPPYVSIEAKQLFKEPLNDCQARSAYMAEMLRGWNVEGDKHFLCGRAHAAEVAYFLKHPVKDTFTQTMAREHLAKVNGSNSDDPLWWERIKCFGWASIGSSAAFYVLFKTAGWLGAALLQYLRYRS